MKAMKCDDKTTFTTSQDCQRRFEIGMKNLEAKITKNCKKSSKRPQRQLNVLILAKKCKKAKTRDS